MLRAELSALTSPERSAPCGQPVFAGREHDAKRHNDKGRRRQIIRNFDAIWHETLQVLNDEMYFVFGNVAKY